MAAAAPIMVATELSAVKWAVVGVSPAVTVTAQKIVVADS